jgi:hypothetical protein
MTPEIYKKARAEVIALFGWTADCLTPDQTLRLDCAVALRLALDDLQGRVIRGEAIDMGRMLTASEALSRLLPSAVLAAPPPEAARSDPRERLWQMYMTARERGGISDHGTDHDFFRALVIEQAEAENERLVPGPLPENVTVLPRPASKSALAAGAERPQPQPPGQPAKQAAPDAPTEPPAYDYNRESGWRDYVEPSGHIRPTPRRGHDWGPV